jgi:hypothetical protein
MMRGAIPSESFPQPLTFRRPWRGENGGKERATSHIDELSLAPGLGHRSTVGWARLGLGIETSGDLITASGSLTVPTSESQHDGAPIAACGETWLQPPASCIDCTDEILLPLHSVGCACHITMTLDPYKVQCPSKETCLS